MAQEDVVVTTTITLVEALADLRSGRAFNGGRGVSESELHAAEQRALIACRTASVFSLSELQPLLQAALHSALTATPMPVAPWAEMSPELFELITNRRPAEVDAKAVVAEAEKASMMAALVTLRDEAMRPTAEAPIEEEPKLFELITNRMKNKKDCKHKNENGTSAIRIATNRELIGFNPLLGQTWYICDRCGARSPNKKVMKR